MQASQPNFCEPGRGNPSRHYWGVILAGGDGRRLLPLTRSMTGDDRPKQFCAIMRGGTLLAQTQRRISPLVPAERTLLVVTHTHERFYTGRVAVAHPSLLVVQPCNRGTLPAILYSLLRICALDPNAVVGFFPSDHNFADDDGFARCTNSAYAAVQFRSRLVMLLGIAPDHPETSYGWIEPGAPVIARPHGSVFRVSRFWEKPSPALAADLMAHGCLWNSFVMVGRADSFLSLIQRAHPELCGRFQVLRRLFFTAAEQDALRDLYGSIAPGSFSDEVLSRYPSDLAVLATANLGWTDLGEPGRVLSLLRREDFAAQRPMTAGG